MLLLYGKEQLLSLSGNLAAVLRFEANQPFCHGDVGPSLSLIMGAPIWNARIRETGDIHSTSTRRDHSSDRAELDRRLRANYRGYHGSMLVLPRSSWEIIPQFLNRGLLFLETCSAIWYNYFFKGRFHVDANIWLKTLAFQNVRCLLWRDNKGKGDPSHCKRVEFEL